MDKYIVRNNKRKRDNEDEIVEAGPSGQIVEAGPSGQKRLSSKKINPRKKFQKNNSKTGNESECEDDPDPEPKDDNASRNVEFSDKGIDTEPINSENVLESETQTKKGQVSKKQGSKKKAYKQKFKDDWKKKYNWVESKDDNVRCKTCDKIITGKVTHLARHNESDYHKKRTRAIAQHRETIDKAIIESQPKKRMQQIAELKMLMFLTEHNLPLSILDHLPKFIQHLCPDSRIAKSIQCGRTKGTSIICDYIAPESLEEICAVIRKKPFSLMIDETTDISMCKCLAVVVRYFDNFGIRDRLLSLVELTAGTADALREAVEILFEKNQIPFSNMIGLAADNCSVMMGNINGVQAQFKIKVPNIFVLGCLCHSMNLCASAACLRLPSTLEDLARDIYGYFSNSPKRIMELKSFQVFVNVEPRKILKLSQTRWLSLEAVVNRILDQWDALEPFFAKASEKDNLQSAKCIHNALRNPIYKVYYTYLSFVLEIVNKINLIFQKQKPIITDLLSTIEKYFRVILACYIKRNYLEKNDIAAINVANPREYLNIDCMYFGAKTELLFSTLQSQELRDFKLRALDFYVCLAKQIKNRIDFNNPVLKAVNILTPTNALSGTCSSIMPLVTLFPNIVQLDALESINSEWRLLPEFKDRLKNIDDPEKFWLEVGCIKEDGKPVFPYLHEFGMTILSLPQSSAATERIFSQLNLIKSKLRSKLHVQTCNSLLLTKEMSNESCYKWEPSKSLLQRLNTKKIETPHTVDRNLESHDENSEIMDEFLT